MWDAVFLMETKIQSYPYSASWLTPHRTQLPYVDAEGPTFENR